MKRIFTLTIIAAALLAGGLHAQSAQSDWKHYGTGGPDNKESYYYYKPSTVRYRASDNGPNDYASVWIKIIDPSGSYDVEHLEQHYTSRRYRILSATSYDGKGSITRSSDTPGEWHEIVPDSLGDTMFHLFWAVKD